MATNIIFGETAEGRISVRVEEDLGTVAAQLREANWVEFTDTKGHPVVVNARNVLYASEYRKSSGRAAGF
jgi:hypothetical protein